jgi:uncharacterized protein
MHNEPLTGIRRSDIPAHGLELELIWDTPLLALLPEGSPDIEPPLHLQLRFSLDNSRVILDGTCQAQCGIRCVRCLERFVYPLKSVFRYVFEKPGRRTAQTHVQIGAEDIEVVYYDGEQIDLVGPVCEQLLLGLPAYPRCSAGCRGLCPHCGANLNNGACTCEAGPRLQSPFAALGRLKKKP